MPRSRLEEREGRAGQRRNFAKIDSGRAERRPVKGNIIILWRIADTIVPLLKHLLSEGACAADSEAATNSRSWRPPSGRSFCRVSWCCVSIEEQRWTRLVQALLEALNSQKSRPEESASRSGPPCGCSLMARWTPLRR